MVRGEEMHETLKINTSKYIKIKLLQLMCPTCMVGSDEG